MGEVLDHNSVFYREKWGRLGAGRFNGAFYYSKEIVKNIIPVVKTDRNWITVNTYGKGAKNHSIVFIHNNLHPENYSWLKDFDDMVLVCGVKSTCEKVKKYSDKVIFLPLSVDVNGVKSFKKKYKTKATAFVGRQSKTRFGNLPYNIDYISGLNRQNLLARLADYREVYAVGRCAIEAKILGCKILPYDRRYPDVSVWKIYDNKTAALDLQKMLKEIDG